MRTRQLKTGTKNIVGQSLYEIRKRKGIKPQDLMVKLAAEGLSITKSAISKIEGGHRAIYDYELLAFSRIYGVSIADIYQTALLKGR